MEAAVFKKDSRFFFLPAAGSFLLIKINSSIYFVP